MQRCGSCHSGAEPKGKRNLVKPWADYDADTRALIVSKITTIDPKQRMPRTSDDKPADLPVAEKIQFLLQAN